MNVCWAFEILSYFIKINRKLLDLALNEYSRYAKKRKYLSKAHAFQVYHALKVTVSSDIFILRIGEQCLLYGILFIVGKKQL